MNDYIDILFLGDIVGKPGRIIVKDYLDKIKNNEIKYGSDNFEHAKSGNMPDFVIANVENASHGFGLTEKNYNELIQAGIDAFTSGNHIWDRKDVFEYIDNARKLIRPFNYPKSVPGKGYELFKINGASICVINVLGRVFMNPIENPWTLLEEEMPKLKQKSDIIILDFHAEATAEKISYGYFADNLGLSAVIGTHTHVQTADEKILKNGCAYISDAGFCGAAEGVIGMDIDSSLKRLKTSLPERFDVAPIEKTELNGVRIVVNIDTGKSEFIERIKYFKDFSEDNKR
ncbi:MAG: TIGR00282 family metallophosphoesterase [Candidatus Gastranaerophilales bacterium]|nr:TIGR00282 family metallophosphoesterase [Candidatus Gastranaerophilales bacterium]